MKAGPPALAEAGLKLEITLLMEKVTVLELAPLGFCTVTFAVPCEAMRLAGTEAAN
jgi:hypothetical protein